MKKKTVLEELPSWPKNRLLVHGRMLGFDLDPDLSSEELADELKGLILGKPDKWLRGIPLDELVIVMELLRLKPEKEFDAGYIPFPLFLETLGYISSRVDAEGNVWFSTSNELWQAMKKGMSKAVDYRRRHLYGDYETVLSGILNIYGVLPQDDIKEIFSELYDFEDNPKLGKVLEKFLEETRLTRYTLYMEDGIVYSCSPFVKNPKSILEERKHRPEVALRKKYTLEEFEAAGFDLFFPFVLEESDAGLQLEDFMRQLGVDEDEIGVIGTSLWQLSQTAGEVGSLGGITDLFGDYLNFDSVSELMPLVFEYFNAVPKWKFNGYSSSDLSRMHVSPRGGFAGGMMAESLPLSDNRAGRSPMENLVDSMIENFSKVPRNAPCPCGSGKKFKNCHGKFS